MARWLCIFTCLYMLACVAAAFAEPVSLRARIEASGPAITLGDVFDGAGAVASRAIAPAPAPGQVASLSMPLLSAVASAAGLEFIAPAGVSEVRVVRPGGMRATLPAASVGANEHVIAASLGASETIMRRGDAVTVSYQAGGVTILLRTRAMGNGSLGQSMRFANPSPNGSPIDAIVTGPNAARISTP